MLVFGALLGGKIHADSHGLVTGQVFPRQLDDVLAVDDGAHKFVQDGVAAVGAFRGGGESQPKRREAEARA